MRDGAPSVQVFHQQPCDAFLFLLPPYCCKARNATARHRSTHTPDLIQHLICSIRHRPSSSPLRFVISHPCVLSPTRPLILLMPISHPLTDCALSPLGSLGGRCQGCRPGQHRRPLHSISQRRRARHFCLPLDSLDLLLSYALFFPFFSLVSFTLQYLTPSALLSNISRRHYSAPMSADAPTPSFSTAPYIALTCHPKCVSVHPSPHLDSACI